MIGASLLGFDTHKLNFELDTALHPFNWLSEGRWLRNVEAEVSIDYVATGIPRAGDLIGDELYLDEGEPLVALPRLGASTGPARSMKAAGPNRGA